MTTSLFAAPTRHDVVAEFRAWGSAVSASLAVVGMIKTADTGQVNWTTVGLPGSAGAVMGYEIWRFNDSLQATAPIFLRIEYGGATAFQGYIKMTLRVGKGSDGAGNLTSPFAAALIMQPSNNGNNTPSNWYMASGDGSMLCLAPDPSVWPLNANGGPVMLVDRSRAADGTATATGIAYFTRGSVWDGHVFAYSGAGYTWSNTLPILSPAKGAAMASGGTIPMFPALVTTRAGHFWQPRAMLGYSNADSATLSAVTVAGFNTYLPLGGTSKYSDSGTNSDAYLAMAWY